MQPTFPSRPSQSFDSHLGATILFDEANLISAVCKEVKEEVIIETRQHLVSFQKRPVQGLCTRPVGPKYMSKKHRRGDVT